jgi:predicted DNA-binding ribbon-helix-helix protein
MRAASVKRSLSIAGHRTSISLEEPFWDALRAIAAERGVSLQALVGEIDSRRAGQNLSSAIRVFVLEAALAGTIGQPHPQIADIEAPETTP